MLRVFGDPKVVYPNVKVCAHRINGGGGGVCTEACEHFQGDTKLGGAGKSSECLRALRITIPASDPRLELEIMDVDQFGEKQRVNAMIARVGANPLGCPHTNPCSQTLPKGQLVLSFTTLSGTQCQQPLKQWPDPQSGLHGPYLSVEDAMHLDQAGVIAWESTAGAEYGFVIVRDSRQKSSAYYTTPPVVSSQKAGAAVTPRVTKEDYLRSLVAGFAGSCENANNFYIAATVHTHPQPYSGEVLLGFIDNFSEPDFNQAITSTKLPQPKAGTSPVCEALPAVAAPPSSFEKIVMINLHDGLVRTFTAQEGDRTIPDEDISNFSATVRLNSLWQCYAKRVKVIEQYNKPQ